MILFKFGTSAARRRRTVPGVELGVGGFPVSRRGLVRRLVCGLLACLLVLHLAFFPVRAKATLAAGALTAVGFAVTVTAFLNLAGIYPFNPDTGEGLTFPEWTDDALMKLVNLYNMAHASAPLTQQTIKSYALGATIAIANEGWNRLRDFVSWIKETYAPADNQFDVVLGTVQSSALALPYYSSMPSASDLVATGFRAPCYSAQYWGTNLKFDNYPVGVVACTMSASGNAYLYFCSGTQSAGRDFGLLSTNGSNFRQVGFPNTMTASDGTVLYVNNYVYTQADSSYIGTWQNLGIPYFPRTGENGSMADYFASFIGQSSVGQTLSGIKADTAIVTTPAAPVADSEFTGIQVGGLGQGVTVDALEDVVESGVQNREQPTVRQVEVEIQVGTEVDSETGEVTENPVVVTPESVIPAVSEFFVPQEFVDTMLTTIRTKFPFCIPFHVLEIVSAFVVAPSAPVISLTFHDNFSDSDYTISVDLSPWDEVAAVVRQFETMLLLVGFLLNFSKFDPLQYFFGNHVGPIGFHD